MLEVSGKSIFGDNACDEDNDNRKRIVHFFGGNDFFDGLDSDMDANGDDDKSNNNSNSALNFGAVMSEFMVTGKFFTSDDQNTRSCIDYAMKSVRDNGD